MIRPRTFGETVAGTLLTMSATAKPSTNLWETPFLDGCFSEVINNLSKAAEALIGTRKTRGYSDRVVIRARQPAQPVPAADLTPPVAETSADPWRGNSDKFAEFLLPTGIVAHWRDPGPCRHYWMPVYR